MNRKRILLVDDELQLVEVMKMRLEANDYEVITAGDGQEALHKVQKEKPDLVLLDILLPKINGYEICKRLKQNEDTINIPVIMMTASGTKDFEEMCYDVGADDCMRKPYNSSELVAKIEALPKR